MVKDEMNPQFITQRCVFIRWKGALDLHNWWIANSKADKTHHHLNMISIYYDNPSALSYNNNIQMVYFFFSKEWYSCCFITVFLPLFLYFTIAFIHALNGFLVTYDLKILVCCDISPTRRMWD